MSTTPPQATYERRIVSILFADLVGFTSLSERLDAEDVAAIQDRYFAAVREAVDRYRGVLEKFIGDAAMAAFGVPRTLDDDAERAARCGLAIVAAVERLDAELGLEPGVIAVRVGIATGEVVYADAGPDVGRLTGDTVNTAARLQTAASPGGVLLSEATALSVAEAIELGPSLTIELKGKAEPVRARAALGSRAVRSREAAMGDLRAPTLGRDAEVGSLLAALDRTHAAATTERWLVVAPPGTGKTRLLEEFSSRVPAGIVVRRARFRADDPRPFGAISELAAELGDRDLVARLIGGGLSAGRASVVAEALGALAGSPEVDRSATIDRESRFGAWLDGFAALAGDGGDLWIVEDAHWAGGDALDFLEAAQDRPTRGGRLVVVSTRPSLLEREPDWSAAGESKRRLDLSGLSGGSAEALVHALVGDAVSAGLGARIAEAFGRQLPVHRGAAPDLGQRRHPGPRGIRLAVELGRRDDRDPIDGPRRVRGPARRPAAGGTLGRQTGGGSRPALPGRCPSGTRCRRAGRGPGQPRSACADRRPDRATPGRSELHLPACALARCGLCQSRPRGAGGPPRGPGALAGDRCGRPGRRRGRVHRRPLRGGPPIRTRACRDRRRRPGSSGGGGNLTRRQGSSGRSRGPPGGQ